VAIADYPLYRGIGKLVGMELLGPVTRLEEKVAQVRDAYEKKKTFIFLHYKQPDTRGEDGDFLGKVKALEEFDKVLPEILKIMDLESDVIAITGDHSTPSLLKRHSHHSVPLLIYSSQNKGYDQCQRFDEKECTKGTFGRIRGSELMACLLARAGKLKKFDL
jgi:2,3-bisphosphoglycerate-independent phosphoglycerate mutase